MAFSHTISNSWSGGGLSLAESNAFSAAAEYNITETVAGTTTDKEVACVLDVSEIKSIYISSDQDLLLETNINDGSIDVINLVAGIPYIWHTGSYFANILDDVTNVTKLFLTNAGATTANFELRCVVDPTP